MEKLASHARERPQLSLSSRSRPLCMPTRCATDSAVRMDNSTGEEALHTQLRTLQCQNDAMCAAEESAKPVVPYRSVSPGTPALAVRPAAAADEEHSSARRRLSLSHAGASTVGLRSKHGFVELLEHSV
jgi:hypothetical protein